MADLTSAALAELVKAALQELGTSSAEVAQTLLAAGITGERHDCRACPVARWVALRVPEVRDAFGRSTWLVSTESVAELDGLRVELPDPVARFITAFDQHNRYPDLEAVKS